MSPFDDEDPEPLPDTDPDWREQRVPDSDLPKDEVPETGTPDKVPAGFKESSPWQLPK